MDGESQQLNWTDEQWTTVRRAVLETARKLRVASSFLPLVGPLPSSVSTVPTLKMKDEAITDRGVGEAEQRLEVDDTDVLPLTTLSVKVYLRNSEANDPDLGSAISMFSRAAEVLARLEDALVFNGMAKSDKKPMKSNGDPIVLPLIYTIGGGGRDSDAVNFAGLRRGLTPVTGAKADIVASVIKAIQSLEDQGHFGPFACVLGHDLFSAATTPTGSLVLPTDRITPFLEGQQVLRSGTLPPDQGLVIALAGNPIDLVVATDMTVKLLQTTLEPRHVFRVYERIALRIKQDGAVCLLGA